MEYSRSLFPILLIVLLINPLLHRRHLFAEAAHFRLYDFTTTDGHVNENVFAYSNRSGETRALVVYHNRYSDTRGHVHRSAAYAIKQPDGTKQLTLSSLAEGLALPEHDNAYVIFRDHVSGLEYIRRCTTLHAEGLYVELGGFTCQVFLDFQVRHDDPTFPCAALAARLNGHGIPSIEQALEAQRLEREKPETPGAPGPIEARASTPGKEQRPGILKRLLRMIRSLFCTRNRRET